jgi:amicyanin
MKRPTWMISMAILGIAAIALVAGGQKSLGANPTQDGGTAVKIDNFSFGPATLTIPAGTSVTWTNQDDVPHTVVDSEGKQFKSPVLDTDQTFSYKFDKPGTYTYFCSIHPKMTGKVVVK